MLEEYNYSSDYFFNDIFYMFYYNLTIIVTEINLDGKDF